jgi:NAD-specific glutamate dehydrogenase
VRVVEAARVLRGRRAHRLDWLREQIERLPVDGQWQAIARTGLRDSAGAIHRKATERVLALAKHGKPEARVSAWGRLRRRGSRALAAHPERRCRPWAPSDFATLSVGIDSVRKLTDPPAVRV